MKSRFLIAAIVVLFLVGALGLLNAMEWIPVSVRLFAALRWICILLFAAHAVRCRSLTVWIFLGMAAGAEFGRDWPVGSMHLEILATIFLRLTKVILAPLLFGTLVVGIAGHADLKRIGRMGIKALVYFEIVSTLALLIGFAAIKITRAGSGLRIPSDAAQETLQVTPHSRVELIINIFPESIAKSVAEGQMLQVVVFSVFFGIALAMVPEAKRKPLLTFSESLTETMFKFMSVVMMLAPVAVFGAVAYTAGHMGMGVVLPLLKLLLTMYAAIIGFALCVLLPIALWARIPLRQFLRAVSEPVTIAFATASSEAALPVAMEKMEALGIQRETVAFVLPTGYSFNLDGSSLYQSVALIFVAQAAGVHLSANQQAMMLLTLLVSSKGTGGVARGSLVIVLAAATSFHLPTEPVFLLFGIDQLMDMARTAVNVLGNCVATVVVARLERETGLFRSEIARLTI
jgi:proton glutamate symport protein